MSMTSSPGNQSGGMGGKSMGGPDTTGPGGYGNNYDGNPNQGGMPTQFSSAGPGMGIGMTPGLGNMYGGGGNPGKGIGMDYRNLGGNPNTVMGGPELNTVMGGPDPLPSTGMGGGKGMGGFGGGVQASPEQRQQLIDQTKMGPGQISGIGGIGGMLPGIIGGQMPPGGAQLVGGAYGRPILGGGIDYNPDRIEVPRVGNVDFNNIKIPSNQLNQIQTGLGNPQPITNQPGGQLVGGQQPQDIYNQYSNAVFGGGDSIYKPNFEPETSLGVDPMGEFNRKMMEGLKQDPGMQEYLKKDPKSFIGNTTVGPNGNTLTWTGNGWSATPPQGGGQLVGGPAGKPITNPYAMTPEEMRGQLGRFGTGGNNPFFGGAFQYGYNPPQPITNQPGGPRNNRFAPPNAPGVRRAPAAAVSGTNPSSPARVAKPITRTRSR